MNTQQNHRTRERGLRIILVTLMTAALVACGSDDKKDASPNATTAPATTEPTNTVAAPVTTEPTNTVAAPVTTEPPDTTSPAVTDGDITQNKLHETCLYRPLEIISQAAAADIQDTLKSSVTDLGRITPSDSPIANNLHLFQIVPDPLVAAQLLLEKGFDATPNYIFGFAPVWHYSPYGPPTVPAEPQHPAALSNGTPNITVLDTGWAPTGTDAATALLNVTSKVVTTSPPWTNTASPASPFEISDGEVAGHGTFIVNLLGQLIPDAVFTVAGISPRFTSDEEYTLPDGTVVSIRDDATVSWALADAVIPGTPSYLNLSFGTYGCTALHDVNNESMETYYVPSGVKTALESLGTNGSQVFVASGNDSLGPYGPFSTEKAIFYPAGWATLGDHEWLHSVASDPKSPTEDYSNRGDWVETQARGSNSVSLLPDTNQWGPEHWAAWSGTSFAAPCALAKFIQDQENPGQDLYFERGSNPNGDYMECGVNLP